MSSVNFAIPDDPQCAKRLAGQFSSRATLEEAGGWHTFGSYVGTITPSLPHLSRFSKGAHSVSR